MSTAQDEPTKPAPLPPTLRCAPLPGFDAARLEAARAAFASAPACPLGQAWRASPEPGFAPGQVRVGWREEALLLFAEFDDRDIFTRSTGLNQRMWELGDTFEIFLRPEGETAYVEFHVTPNNQRLQLRFPGTEALRKAQADNVFDAFLLPGDVFHSMTWVQPEHKKWFVHAVIPAAAVGDSARLAHGVLWHFSFSRYDYTRGPGQPVISSTSPHPVADFHRQQEWGVLNFAKASVPDGRDSSPSRPPVDLARAVASARRPYLDPPPHH